MLYSHLQRLQAKSIHWCYIHLVVSIYSFLILVNWGAPFCAMSLLGNLIFGPVLALFLFCSTILFFFEILSLPNQYIIYLLDIISNSWIYILKSGSFKSLQIPCTQPSALVTTTVACGTFLIIIMHCSYIKKNTYLCLLLLCSFLLAQQTKIKTIMEELPCANGTLHIIKTDNQLTLIDPGCLGRYISAPSFVEYKLIPHIIKRHGTQTIDHLILLQPGKITFDAVNTFLQKGFINNIYIPYWKGTLSKSALKTFMQIKENLIKHNGQMHRLSNHEIMLIRNSHTNLTIKPLNQEIKKTSIQFKAFCVGDTIDKQPITFYPAKYNPKK